MTVMTGPPKIDPALVRAAPARRPDRHGGPDGRAGPLRGPGVRPDRAVRRPGRRQEALIVIFRNLGGLREPGAIYGWARAIAVREAVRVARKTARAVPAELADVPASGDPQLAADVRDVLARLTLNTAPSWSCVTWRDWTSRRRGRCWPCLPRRYARGCSGPGAASGRHGRHESGLARGRTRPGPPDAGPGRGYPRRGLRGKNHPRAVQRRVGSRQRPGTRTASHGHRPAVVRDHQRPGGSG